MANRPRILVVGKRKPEGAAGPGHYPADADVVRAASWYEALAILRLGGIDMVVSDPSDPALVEAAGNLLQAQAILAALPDGVAIVDFDLKIRWANPSFLGWCGGPVLGRGFYEALGTPEVVGPDYCPFHTALSAAGGHAAPLTVTHHLRCRANRHIDLHITPLPDPEGRGQLVLAIGRDVTAIVQQRQKLDALHKAGGELAELAPDRLADMPVAERVELLKQNIRKFVHELLHYSTIEIRILDRRTRVLEPLLQEGMADEAAARQLRASPEGNGVTGFVAATGKSYICPDTTVDPLYLQGVAGARSSLTVPLIYRDQVVGTFNVESTCPDAFGEDDLQFTEIFSHDIAAALHTLELLSAEQREAASRSVEAIMREVVLPVDEILAAATTMLGRYLGHDAEMADKLRKILSGARAIKQSIQKVGEDVGPERPAAVTGEPASPRLKGMRVLVAENDERTRRSAHGLLGRWGCVVETARDADEALTMARLSNYDAILMDIRLPDVDGYEIYRKLRAAQPRARVILMTAYGYDANHTIVRARKDGLKFVLYKPFRVDQLLVALSSPDA